MLRRLGGERRTRLDAVSPEVRSSVAWGTFAVVVVASLLVLPFAGAMAQGLRVDLCRGHGGCGYQPPRTRCELLSRDIGMASSLTVLDRAVDSRRKTEVTTTVDGVTVVRLPGGGSDGAFTTVHFDGPDDARAWLEQRAGRYRPVHAAAVGGPGSVDAGMDRLLRSLGFEGEGAEVGPQETELGADRQLGAGAYLGVFAPVVSASGGAEWTRLASDGSSTSSGRLPAGTSLADAGTSLATRLGMVGEARYTVVTDGNGEPALLLLRGEALQRDDGTFVASSSLVRLQERGEARGQGPVAAERQRAEGRHVVQTVVLGLRASANLAAFRGAFVSTDAATVPRSAEPVVVPGSGRVAVDLEGLDARVGRLVERLAQDGVYVRERSRTTVVPAERAGGATTRETTLIDAYSQDFAVPASELTRLPGCSR